MNIYNHVFHFFVVIFCAYAIFRGGYWEYWGAGIFTVAVTVQIIWGMFSVSGGWYDTRFGVLLVDLVVLLALLYVALKSDRFWPLWCTGFHIVAVATHMAAAIGSKIIPWAYAISAGFWAYPMLIVLAIGAHENADRKAS